MKGIGEIMQQMQEIQSRMQQMQRELEEAKITGEAGGGMVRVTITGKGEMTHVEIDESLLKPEEKEIVEDLVVAAANQARERMEELMQEKMKEATGGLPLPPGFSM